MKEIGLKKIIALLLVVCMCLDYDALAMAKERVAIAAELYEQYQTQQEYDALKSEIESDIVPENAKIGQDQPVEESGNTLADETGQVSLEYPEITTRKMNN